MPRIVGRAITGAALDEARQGMSIDLDADLGADQVAVLLAGKLDAEPMIRLGMPAADAAQHHHTIIQHANHAVGPSVIVEITDGHAAATNLAVEKRAAAGADVVELAIAVVAKEHRPLVDAGDRRVADYVAVDDHDVEPTVMIDVDEARAPADKALSNGRDAGSSRAEKKQIVLAEVLVKGVIFILVVRDEERGQPGAVVITDVHSHAAVGNAVFIASNALEHADFFELEVAAIDVQEIVHRVVGDVDVGPAVAVEIGDDDAQPLARVFASLGAHLPQVGLLAHVGESAVAVIAVDDVRQAFELTRRTNVALDVGLVAAALRVVVERPIDVMTYVEIGKAIAVEIGPGGARGPAVIR